MEKLYTMENSNDDDRTVIKCNYTRSQLATFFSNFESPKLPMISFLSLNCLQYFLVALYMYMYYIVDKFHIASYYTLGEMNDFLPFLVRSRVQTDRAVNGYPGTRG